MSAHAFLSPSGAHRWLECTPSAALEAQFPNEQSTYSLEGTLAHSFGEMKLRAYFQKAKINLNELRKSTLYTPEIDTCTDQYVDYVKTVANHYDEVLMLAVEQKYNLKEVVPDSFGTSDCTLIGGTDLHVIDYKHGKGVFVSAEDNPQARLYALGAYHNLSLIYDIKQVTIHIVQPRLDNFSTETLDIATLLEWAEWVRGKAKMAANGEGDYNPGEHCRFCRARHTCRARADQYSALADFGRKLPPLLTDQEVGEALLVATDYSKWIDDLKSYALQKCLDGGEINGWKAVAGRAVRVFTDAQAALDKLVQSGYDEALLYERKPLTLAGLEKVIGKKEFADTVGEFISTPTGKPTLAPADDKRNAYQGGVSAEEDFE